MATVAPKPNRDGRPGSFGETEQWLWIADAEGGELIEGLA